MSDKSSEALLDVKGLSVAYRDRELLTLVVRKVSFAIRPGEVVGLMGESGSGKTSTALAIPGLLPEAASVDGEIRFGGIQLVGAPENGLQRIRGAQISFIPQEPLLSLNPVLRAIDQVAQVVRAHTRLTASQSRNRAESVLNMVGLAGERLQRSYPHQLSGGQRQRVLIAQATVCRPALVIADEPTGSLDPAAERDMLALLRSLVEQLGISLFLITHDPQVLRAAADRVMVMYAGRIVESGPTRAVLESPFHPYTRALLGCLLETSPNRQTSHDRRMAAIKGSPPDFHQLPRGCAFEPRCNDRMSCCDKAEPAASYLGAREVSCFLYAQPG